MKIIFATNNAHKLSEVQQILGDNFTLLTPKMCGVTEDIPEEQDTIEGNALQKAHYLHDRTHENCFADDTGLEIEALGGEPGVYSARYAGEKCSFEDNMNLVLSKLEGVENRKACFKTVIALILEGKEYCFEGRVDGEITTEYHGDEGFGYDPIFRPEGYKETFAQMSSELKNKISHRGLAVAKLNEFLAKK
ncbi:MAG: non-canonical purine NTP diphosphatase [Rikenellaceae bacterium]